MRVVTGVIILADGVMADGVAAVVVGIKGSALLLQHRNSIPAFSAAELSSSQAD